jgi:hypothetical protein
MKLAFSTLIGALAILLLPSAGAQAPITLDDLLLRLEDNLQYYDSDVPGFFCDEHAVSKVSSGLQTRSTVTESTFRVKRVPQPDGTANLVESRDIKTVDGRPAKGEELTGPATLSGPFASGLAIVSLRQATCTGYTLQPVQPDRPDAPYIVQFATVPKSQGPDHCVIQDDGSGRALIDSDTMQVMRMEFKAPHHVIIPESKTDKGRTIPAIVGTWNVTVDYGKVSFGDQEFWVPATIIGTLVGGRGPTTWSFEAHYTNFHKMEVDSRVLPADDTPQP